MSHFSPVPPDEREYAKNYRKELTPFEAELVEVSARCKEFRDHPERKDLQSTLLVNVQVRPQGKRKVIKLSHLWVLTKHIKRVGVEPKRGRRLKFIGSVYAYFRLGGKSKQRGLLGLHDFSILPMEAVAIETFKSGINARYENKDGGSDIGGAPSKETGGDRLGKSPTDGSEHIDCGHGDDGNTIERSGDRDSKSGDDKRQRSSRPRRSRKPRASDSKRSTKDSRDN